MAECPDAAGIDFEAYLVDPRADQFAAFRGHFPTCARCSRELAALSRVEAALRSATSADAHAHPEARALLAYQSAESAGANPVDSGAHLSLRLHLESCALCRDELAALAGFDFAGSSANVTLTLPATPGIWHRLSAWLGDLAAPLPVSGGVALAAVGIALAVVVGPTLWSAIDGSPPVDGLASESSQPEAERHTPIDLPAPEAGEHSELAAASSAESSDTAGRTMQGEAGAPETPPATPGATTHEPQQQLANVDEPTVPTSEAAGPVAVAPNTAERAARQGAIAKAPVPTPDASAGSSIDALWAETGAQPLDQVRLAHADLGPPRYAAPRNELGPGRVHDVLRSGDPAIPDLRALAPDHAGRTLRASPTLYWYASAATPGPLTFSLVDPAVSQAVLEVELDAARSAGIRGVSLADHETELAVGTVYQWFVALPEPADDGFVIVAGGSIVRVPGNDALHQALLDIPPAHRGHHLAQSGYFYDAIDLFSAWRAEAARSALLVQAGLDLP